MVLLAGPLRSLLERHTKHLEAQLNALERRLDSLTATVFEVRGDHGM